MDYREALEWIHSRERFGIRPGLERVRCILSKLSNPHQQLKVIHIGGTNGKGSTAAFTASVLREAGFKTGLYTSPYLESFTNRMAVDGQDVAEDVLVSLVEKVKPIVEEMADKNGLGPATEFEVVTALAFLYFAQVGVDYLVLEVGLGGRLDATNVVEAPLVSVVTNVSLEHVDILGDTVSKIAFEKAGIIKKGVPVLTASCDPEVLEVLRQRATECNSSLYKVGEDVTFQQGKWDMRGQTFHYQGLRGSLADLFIPLLGEHQAVNAVTALAALELAGVQVAEETIRKGLKKTCWPGRLEILQEDPLVIIDAAHNIDGIKSLSRALQEYFPKESLVVVIGILKDKSIREILRILTPAAEQFIITRALHPSRAADPKAVAEEARRLTAKPVVAVDDLAEAIKKGQSLAAEGGILCVTGSFYTISEARRLIVEEKII